MRIVHIREKLDDLEIPIESFALGDFDEIGEVTAKKRRPKDDPNYASVGAFFKPNLERAILIAALIRKFGVSSMLEVGFGRGYATFCAAKAMIDEGVSNPRITTIDPVVDETHIGLCQQIFPREWFGLISYYQGISEEVIPTMKGERFDLVYIDGDHTYDAVKRDWELVKDMCDRFVLFDDYHLPTKDSGPGIQVAAVVDEIDWESEGFGEPELIRSDRRIFMDDRGLSDEEVDYGQCLIEKKVA